jgi:protein-S-isoprenylcysteine O-methyltransferase Ste14
MTTGAFAQNTGTQPGKDVTRGVIRRIVQIVMLVLVQAAMLFLSAGSLRWINGWAYIGVYVLALVVAAAILIPRSPEMVAARSEIRKDAKGWDKWLALVMAIFTWPGIVIVAGLDERYGWSSVPVAAQIAGAAAFIAGYAQFLWAMISNVHFEMFVRIQHDRGHQVMTGGPYRIVRHPAYLGQVISLLGMPFFLDSLWTLIGVAGGIAVIIIRTAIEDRTLHAELEGYREFASRTRYRLLPGIW